MITLDEGKLITLPFPVFSGDVVLLETGVGDVTGAAFPDPSTWSDVVRFCDDPLQDPCQTEFATHVQVMSDQEGATTFIDEFTGHSLDASKLSSNPPAIAIPESTTGPTPYLFYSINSDPTGPGETLEAVGGIVMPANNFAIAAPWLAIIGLVGSLGTVAVVAKKRRE